MSDTPSQGRSHSEPVSVLLAGPDLHGFVLRQMLPVVDSDPARFRLANVAGSWDNLVYQLETMAPELLVVGADIAAAPDELVKLLGSISARVVVILPSTWAELKESLERVHTVCKVFIGPIGDWPAVLAAGYGAVVTERTRTQGAAPLQSLYAGSGNALRAGAAAVGTRVIAFVSARGGTGRSTIAESLAYELAVRRNIRTLLYSFDLPPSAAQHLQLNYNTNASLFFRRPASFREVIQTREGLDVILAPSGSHAYAEAARLSDDDPSAEGALRSLVQASWAHGYGAVLLDLPAGESNWTLHPVLAANTVLVVARPTVDDVAGAVHTVRLLTKHLAGRHRIPREAMFCVLNRVTPHTRLKPKVFHADAAKFAGGFFPPILASFVEDPTIPNIQERQQIPGLVVDGFGRNIRLLADTFFGDEISGNGNMSFRGRRVLGKLGIKVKLI